MNRPALALAACLLTLPSYAQPVQMEMCGRNQPNTPDKTCVVDGDTVWLHGQNLRLMDFDTPEPQTNICGGEFEIALAHQAGARLRELLNTNEWTVETFGADRYNRTLATIRIDRVDVGDILIAEGLARRWPDGEKWWCD